MVKVLVSALDGKIELGSDVGRGSKFTIVLLITKLKEEGILQGKLQQTDSRIMQAVEIEFSDIYI